MGKNLTKLTASSKQSLLKPEMNEDLKCPNARMIWDSDDSDDAAACSLHWTLLSGGEAVPSLQKRLKEDCTAPRPRGGGTGQHLGLGPPFVANCVNCRVLNPTERCCVSGYTMQKNGIQLKRLQIKSNAREG